MPEVERDVQASLQLDTSTSPTSNPNPTSPTSGPRSPARGISFIPSVLASPLSHTASPASTTASRGRRKSSQLHRRSTDREDRDVYYDSRAATKFEFKRRASTLQQYYAENPTLLPQLPFTWRHGWRRWKLAITITIMVIDACIVPIVLYYAMTFGGNVQGWIVFAIVATLWGGPTYIEFALRSWRLIKKEHFYRPLGATTRTCFDITHYVFIITITAVTALLVVGSAPHIVFIRVLAMPGPAILFSIGGCLFVLTMWSLSGRKAPFRISSTPKGGTVNPGAYYFMEDVIAVNGNAGRPFREALAARYVASPIFRRMIRNVSLFWSVPSLLVAIACTVVVCIHSVPAPVGYGIGWGVPFVWAGIWTAITVPWVQREMHKEKVTWEAEKGIAPLEKNSPGSDEDKPEP